MNQRTNAATQPPMDNGYDRTEQALQLGKDVIQAWNDHDIETLTTYYSEDYIGTDVAQKRPFVGLNGLRLKFLLFFRAFPDATFEIVDMTTQEDRLVLHWLVRGTHLGKFMNIPPSRRMVVLHGASFITIIEGKIERSFYLWDVAALLRQFGLLPELTD